MANNEVFDGEMKLAVVASAPASPTSGSPCRYGNMTGVALTDKRTADNLTPIDFGYTTWALSVKGINDSGNSAVAVGDSLYFVDADTPNISKKASGYFFGIALQTVGSGSTATINVMHYAQAGIVPAGSITKALLTATLGIGIIHLPLGQWRIPATNDIDVKANVGGLVAHDTTPYLERINTTTDKQERLRWAATVVNEIVLAGIISPPDLDNTQPVIFKAYAAMGGATNTPVVAVSCFEGVGGSELGGNTGAITGTTPAIYTVNLTVTAVAGTPKPWAFGLTPAAHGTDALYLMAAWLEYTRK